MDQPDGLGEDARAAVGQIIARDARDDRVLELEMRDCLGDAPGLVLINRAPACRDSTAQNRQLRVQVLPRIMNVAVRARQHSPMFGQFALWQTVCSRADSTSRFTSS